MNGLTVASLAQLAGVDRVFRAFDHLIVHGYGLLLMAPMAEVQGDLREVTDGCPVPWIEVVALLDVPPAGPVPVLPAAMCRDFPLLATLTPYGWMRDSFSILPGSRPVGRMVHACGVRVATINDRTVGPDAGSSRQVQHE